MRNRWCVFFCAVLLWPVLSRCEEFRPRIVSLAPSITEMFYALGVERMLAGVTDDSIYPAEAAALPRVGTFSQPDVDAVNALRPDVVLVLVEHRPSYRFFDRLTAKPMLLEHRTLDGILDSLTLLGELCSMPAEAGKMRDELQASLVLPPGYDQTAAPSMLLIIGSDFDAGLSPTATVVGNDGLYARLITAVGCRNAYPGDIGYPTLSSEAIAWLDPDIIVEGVYAKPGAASGYASALHEWLPLTRLRAGRNDSIFCIRSDYAFVPGLRMALMKRDLENIVRQTGLTGDRPPGFAVDQKPLWHSEF